MRSKSCLTLFSELDTLIFMKKHNLSASIFSLMCILICSCKESNPPLFEKLSSNKTGIHFINTIIENDSVNMLNYYYCYNGGGVGIADFNNDNLPDIFFTGNMLSSKLYLNKGNMQFEDITLSAGLTTHDWIMGVSVVDINNDGFMDIYLNVAGPQFARKHHNLLYINQINVNGSLPRFKEESANYGLDDSSFCVQSAFLDYDRDGDLDMYLLTNDVDRVGKSYIMPASYPTTGGKTIDRFYENVGDTLNHPLFKNVSSKAGIIQEGYGLGLAIGDLNGDGWADVYAANDFMPNDQLLINQKNKTFKDVAAKSMRHQTYNGMGVDIEDINNDAKPDIMVMDMLPENNERRKTMIAKTDYESFFLRQKAGYVDEYMRNTLQLNQGIDKTGNLFFSDIAQFAGVNATDWSWGVLLSDFDNDGLRDAYITNGFVKDITDLDYINYNQENNMFGTNKARDDKSKGLVNLLKGVKLSNYMYKNKGDLSFDNTTETWGLKYNSYSNGAAYADLDNDGDQDLVVNNINEEAYVFENKAIKPKINENSYLQITLKGNKKNVNGVGSTVTLYCGKQQFYNYFSPVKGYLSSMNTPLHIGLGKINRIDSVKVIWADEKLQIIKSIQVNQRLTLRHDHATNGESKKVLPPIIPVFNTVNKQYGVDWEHIENEYNDFIDEPTLLSMNSKKGPGIAVGDVDHKNGTDFFIGGSKGNQGTLFLQTPKGSFIQKKLNNSDAKYEDMGSILFDADNNNDLDLYVVSGGSESKNELNAFQDRLYLNDGKGNFTKNETALPLTTSSGSCVVVSDYDKDGDLDVFRAGALSAGNDYVTPRSYLLRNDGGKFTDITDKIAPELKNIGMVNSAVWSDFDNDGWQDLIIAGEWVSPTFFKNQKGKLENVTEQTGLEDMNGLWNSVFPADIDNDGDVDYVFGNMGTNIDYRPSKNQPLEMFYGDFANTGKYKAVFTTYLMDNSGNKNPYPITFRDDFFQSMPLLKKKFANYQSYSVAQLGNIFSKETISKAKHLTTNTFQSCILINNGNGKFVVKPLPPEAQFSCIYGILATDVDLDGNLDILITGNSHSNEVVYGWMDASLGLLLKGNGKGDFKPQSAEQSGLFLHEATRGIGLMYDSKGHEIIMAVANSNSLNLLSVVDKSASPIIYAHSDEIYAEITLKNGKKRKQEFYFGAGYLSQQVRAICLNKDMKFIQFYNRNGKIRKLDKFPN